MLKNLLLIALCVISFAVAGCRSTTTKQTASPAATETPTPSPAPPVSELTQTDRGRFYSGQAEATNREFNKFWGPPVPQPADLAKFEVAVQAALDFGRLKGDADFPAARTLLLQFWTAHTEPGSPESRDLSFKLREPNAAALDSSYVYILPVVWRATLYGKDDFRTGARDLLRYMRPRDAAEKDKRHRAFEQLRADDRGVRRIEADHEKVPKEYNGCEIKRVVARLMLALLPSDFDERVGILRELGLPVN